MAQSNIILDKASAASAANQKRWNSRAKRLIKALALTDAEIARDIGSSNSMANMSELLREVEIQKDPKKKAMLGDAYAAILENVAPFAPDHIVQQEKQGEGKSQESVVPSLLDRIMNIFTK